MESTKRKYKRTHPPGKVELRVPPVPISEHAFITGSGVILRYMFPADGAISDFSVKINGPDVKRVNLTVKVVSDKGPGAFAEFTGKPTGYSGEWKIDVDKGAILEAKLDIMPGEAKAEIWASCLYFIDPRYDVRKMIIGGEGEDRGEQTQDV